MFSSRKKKKTYPQVQAPQPVHMDSEPSQPPEDLLKTIKNRIKKKGKGIMEL